MLYAVSSCDGAFDLLEVCVCVCGVGGGGVGGGGLSCVEKIIKLSSVIDEKNLCLQNFVLSLYNVKNALASRGQSPPHHHPLDLPLLINKCILSKSLS